MPGEPQETGNHPIPSRDELVLVLAPTGRDGPLTCALLEERARVRCESASSVEDLCDRIRRGTGVAIVTEEAIDAPGVRRLTETLTAQLPWSDLPVLVMTSGEAGGDAIAELRRRGNVTVLDRPVRIVTLVSAVLSALRARRRQYEVRDLLAETRNAVRQRDQFLAMLGHELRNPLATVTNTLTVLDATCPPANESEQEQRDIIRRQNEHLARLVDDLLDVARITSGKISLQCRPIDFADAARRAVKATELSARAQEHELVISLPAQPILVHADPVRIEQVINNLLTNAIKYTPPGGHVEVAVRGEEEQAILRVRDNGIGIRRELLTCIFDLFTQAEPALDRSKGGLGIGLTLVRALVEMHQGRVDVHSAGPNRGSEFTVTLPLLRGGAISAAPVNARPGAGIAAANGPVAQRRRILIIEDQPDARRVLQRLLEIWGHDVDAAEDGIRGIDLAARHPPDVAFIDVGLPGLDGYEVARRLRASLGERVHLVALTGYGQPEDRDRAYDAGFDLHLIKPVDRDQLQHALAPTSRQRRHTTLQEPIDPRSERDAAAAVRAE
jgi:signal transduction histidine kinase/ActR/RegA family two-component response regulator